MKVTIRRIQTFYAEQMEVQGHGYRTFLFETDAQGEPLIHRVDGQRPDSYYFDNTRVMCLTRLDKDVWQNIYFIVIDNGRNVIGAGGGGFLGGVASPRGKNGGFALVPGGFYWKVAAHELGHAFGLQHDFRDGAYIMSYGPGRDRLSACAAELLTVHSYFNASILEGKGREAQRHHFTN